MSDQDDSQSNKPTPLFRKQAVAYQSRSLDGEVLLSLSMRMRVLIALAVVVIIGTAIFFTKASYARIETVAGWVVPEAGLIRVTAPRGGIVNSLAISEGDEVGAGQSLAQLRLSADLEDGSAGQALKDQLNAQMEAARAQAEAEKEQLLAEEASLLKQREALKHELEQGRSRIETMRRQLELVQSNAERVRKVAKRGFASTKSVEESEMNVLVAQQELSNVRSNALSMERQVDDINAQLHSLPISIRAAEARARASSAQLALQGTEMETQNIYHVGATVAGKVVALPVARGQTVPPQTVIAVVTPKGSTLEAELYVPSRSAGFIKAEQEVRLMYQAFPYQKFGTTKGIVRSVSRTVLAPSEVAIPGLDIQEPVFRVKVALETDQVRAYGQDIQVQPGMLLTANIVIDRRNLVEWLLDPIYAVGKLG